MENRSIRFPLVLCCWQLHGPFFPTVAAISLIARLRIIVEYIQMYYLIWSLYWTVNKDVVGWNTLQGKYCLVISALIVCPDQPTWLLWVLFWWEALTARERTSHPLSSVTLCTLSCYFTGFINWIFKSWWSHLFWNKYRCLDSRLIWLGWAWWALTS